MVPGVSQIQTLSSILTGGTTVAVVAATVLVACAVAVPPWRRTASLPAALFALVGAIAARFTQTSTAFGDEVFRGSTVLWSLGLAVACVVWWLAAEDDARRRDLPAGTAAAGSAGTGGAGGRGEIDGAGGPVGAGGVGGTGGVDGVASDGAPHSRYRAGGTAVMEQPTPARKRASFSPWLMLTGTAALVVAVCTFLTATGIYPVGLSLFAPA